MPRKRWTLLALVATTAMAGASAGAAYAGEITGNGKPTQGPTHANSICVFSGQNDDPTAPIISADTELRPGRALWAAEPHHRHAGPDVPRWLEPR
jgi:hypothetical protein